MEFSIRPELRRLQDYLDSVTCCPYELGQMDCFIFLCAVIKSFTLVDYSYLYEGQYKTRHDALQLIQNSGGFIEGIKKYTGKDFTRTRDKNRLEDGDVVLFKFPLDIQPHIGVKLRHSIVFPGDKGIMFLYDGYTLLGFWRFI